MTTRTAIDIRVASSVWLDFLDPYASGMQAELGLPEPTFRRIGNGGQYSYAAVPVDTALELAEYLYDRADTLLGQGISDPYDRFEKAARATLRSAIGLSQRIQAEVLAARQAA
jgi:hypothetical protein